MKILAFAPHSAIWPHAFPEALVAEALSQSGHTIVYVSCGGQFKEYCIPMSAFGLTAQSSVEEKQKVCTKCKRHRDIIRREFGFSGPDIIDLLQPSDFSAIEEHLKHTDRLNFIDLEIDGISVGRYALYEFLINAKKDSVNLTEEDWAKFHPEFVNALYSFYASKRVLDQERPDRVMAYNSFYSVNHVFCELAAQRGIPHYFIHAGNNIDNRMQTLFVTRGYGITSWNRNSNWPRYRDVPCNQAQLETVTNHVLALLKGLDVFAYSAPKSGKVMDLKTRFGVGPEQQVLLATMSSSDERVAAEAIGVQFSDENCVYPTQVEWVEALIDYAKQHSELCLIIRVHPRNFPNKREKLKSAQAVVLEKILRDLPSNVKVNWPADQISIYDMAEIADVVLNGWSNAGKEMSLLGLPVVLYSPELVTSYPSTLNYVGATTPEYFKQIEQALAEGWSFEKIRAAYRWCAFEYSRSLFDISESNPPKQQYGLSLGQRIVRRLLREVFPGREQKNDCRQRASQLRTKSMINAVVSHGSESLLDEVTPEYWGVTDLAQETAFLKIEISRLLKGLYGDDSKIPVGGLGEKLRKYA